MLPVQFNTGRAWWARVKSVFTRSRWPWLPWAILGFFVFFIAALILPRSLALFWYPGIKRLFYEDLGLSSAESTLFALVLSFLYAALWLPFLRWSLAGSLWKFHPRRFALGLLAGMAIYGTTPFLHAIYGTDVCFNQRTGESLQWFVIAPGGNIVRYDSPGYDAAGVPKQPVTRQICRIIELQKRGIRPQQIVVDPREVKFFDEITGQPRVWYSRGENGRISLFDGEGTNPITGELFKPITKNEVQEAQAQAAAKQAEAEHAAQLKAELERQRAADAERKVHLEAERKEAEAKEDARKRLITVFDTASYSSGVVIVGATPQQNGDTSALAARNVVAALSASLRRKGIPADEFRPQVYADGYFKTMFTGNAAVLTEVGLAQKMRAALLANIYASCRPVTSDLISCTLTAEIRILGNSGAASLTSVSETGAGATTEQATSRAAELIAERHADIFEGI